MNIAALKHAERDLRSNEATKSYSFEGWSVHEYATVHSTNLVAADLPPWSVVRADTQTDGRGRFQRSWISDQGGLWLSAAVPYPAAKPDQRSLPLSVGLAVCEALKSLGVSNLRMRWPNDILVNQQKLAGVLLDQFKAEIAVVGIGINVQNRPEAQAAALRNQTVRLADLLADCPALPDLMRSILSHIRHVLVELQSQGFNGLLPRVNKLWGPPRRVELDLDGNHRQGLFTKVDPNGRLILFENDGACTTHEPNKVRHLKEI